MHGLWSFTLSYVNLVMLFFGAVDLFVFAMTKYFLFMCSYLLKLLFGSASIFAASSGVSGNVVEYLFAQQDLCLARKIFDLCDLFFFVRTMAKKTFLG